MGLAHGVHLFLFYIFLPRLLLRSRLFRTLFSLSFSPTTHQHLPLPKPNAPPSTCNFQPGPPFRPKSVLPFFFSYSRWEGKLDWLCHVSQLRERGRKLALQCWLSLFWTFFFIHAAMAFRKTRIVGVFQLASPRWENGREFIDRQEDRWRKNWQRETGESRENEQMRKMRKVLLVPVKMLTECYKSTERKKGTGYKGDYPLRNCNDDDNLSSAFKLIFSFFFSWIFPVFLKMTQDAIVCIIPYPSSMLLCCLYTKKRSLP